VKIIFFVLLLACAGFVRAAEKPTVYNHVNKESADLDPAVRKALEPKFMIEDLPEVSEYTSPKLASGKKPRTARTEGGEPLGGQVLVAFVVAADGQSTDASVLKTTDERLNGIATKAVLGWRFEPGQLKGKAIPTTAAQEFDFEVTPTEFGQQILEPMGGRIARPKGWFYAEAHRGPVYMWTLSREDSAGGKRYDTGVRIQTFMKVKEGAGKTAQEFIMDFVEAKKKAADRVVKTCDPKEQRLFTRICLETEEGPHHILYSLFWGSKDLDVAVVLIAGTTRELWDTYAPTFDKMSNFELIDMKRFEK
jgi:TonB family protein